MSIDWIARELEKFHEDYDASEGNVKESLRDALTKLAERGVGPLPTGPTWDDAVALLSLARQSSGPLSTEPTWDDVMKAFRKLPDSVGAMCLTLFYDGSGNVERKASLGNAISSWGECGPAAALTAIQAAMPKPEPVTAEQAVRAADRLRSVPCTLQTQAMHLKDCALLSCYFAQPKASE